MRLFRAYHHHAISSVFLLLFVSFLPHDGSAQIPPASSTGAFRVAGTVINSKGGHPLAGVRVSLADTRNRRDVRSLVTSENGRFEFEVGPGKYSLQGAKRGFISAYYNQHEQFSTAIVTGAGLDTENLMLRLAPSAVLTGKVFDESGDPVDSAAVLIYRENHQSGVALFQSVRGATTDNQGTYEVTPLDEGTFYVGVEAKPWYAIYPPTLGDNSVSSFSQVDRSLDVAYPITYYANTTERDDATPIPIRVATELK